MSFIPKKTIGQPERRRAGSLGSFILLSVFLSLISGASWGALLMYKQALGDNIEQLGSSLKRQRESFETETLSEVVTFSKKIELVRNLAGKHVAVSGVFDFLQDFTVREITYGDMSLTLSPDGGPALSLTGAASGYPALAVQSGVFEKNSFVKSSSFSNLAADPRGGIKFNLKLNLKPEVIKYNP